MLSKVEHDVLNIKKKANREQTEIPMLNKAECDVLDIKKEKLNSNYIRDPRLHRLVQFSSVCLPHCLCNEIVAVKQDTVRISEQEKKKKKEKDKKMKNEKPKPPDWSLPRENYKSSTCLFIPGVNGRISSQTGCVTNSGQRRKIVTRC